MTENFCYNQIGINHILKQFGDAISNKQYKNPIPYDTYRKIRNGFKTIFISFDCGDMVLHRGKPMYVQSVEGDGIHCIDILNSENKVIVPVTNMFGFNFVTKVVSLMNFNAAQPSAENPFGNLMPFMMMSSVMGDDSDNDFSKMMMMGGSNPFTAMFTPQDK